MYGILTKCQTLVILQLGVECGTTPTSLGGRETWSKMHLGNESLQRELKHGDVVEVPGWPPQVRWPGKASEVVLR
jgi:hypothetical protein